MEGTSYSSDRDLDFGRPSYLHSIPTEKYNDVCYRRITRVASPKTTMVSLTTIEQLYQQIQTWGTGKFNVVVPGATYLMNDVTGDNDITGDDNYQASRW